VAPDHVTIVDSAESTAKAVARKLEVDPLSSPDQPERRTVPRLTFFATDSAEKFKKMGSRFLGHPVSEVVHVDLKE
jgi:glutamate racemase